MTTQICIVAFALNAIPAATATIVGGPPLDEDLWHVTDYYENIRNKVRSLDESLGKCHDIKSKLPARMCNTPMKVGMTWLA
jgi:hypothetical protein